MNEDIIYFEVDSISEFHDTIIEISGGLPGIKDFSVLSSTIDFMKNDFYYPNFIDKLVYLIYNLSKSHPFLDANKRTALFVGGFFLEINGYDDCLERYLSDIEDLILFLVEDLIDKKTLSLFIEYVINGDEYSESMKLLLANCYIEHYKILDTFK